MKKYRVAVVGLGHAARWHIDAIASFPEMYELVAVCDKDKNKNNDFPYSGVTNFHDLIQYKPDLISVCVGSQYHFDICRYFLDKGINLLVEKPIVTDLDQWLELTSLAKEKGSIINGAYHAMYSSCSIWAANRINADISGSFNSSFGRLIEVKLNRYDPYVFNNEVLKAPEVTSTNDSLPNILSELSLYVRDFSLVDSAVGVERLFSGVEVERRCKGIFPGGTFETNTSWIREVNQKNTTLNFENGQLFLDHTNQLVKEKDGLGNEMYYHFDTIGERIPLEYIRMYGELYEVLGGVKKTNIDLSEKIVKILSSV